MRDFEGGLILIGFLLDFFFRPFKVAESQSEFAVGVCGISNQNGKPTSPTRNSLARSRLTIAQRAGSRPIGKKADAS